MSRKPSGRPSGLQQPVTPSPDLAAIVGRGPMPRSQVVSKIWDHIRKNNLQNPRNKREIVADDKLKRIFGKDRVSMFEMNKHLSEHLRSAKGRDSFSPDAADDSSSSEGFGGASSASMGDTHGSGGGRGE